MKPILGVVLLILIITCWNAIVHFIKRNLDKSTPMQTSYQINLHNDTLFLYDGSRLVGMHIDDNKGALKHGAFIDSLITNDNK